MVIGIKLFVPLNRIAICVFMFRLHTHWSPRPMTDCVIWGRCSTTECQMLRCSWTWRVEVCICFRVSPWITRKFVRKWLITGCIILRDTQPTFHGLSISCWIPMRKLSLSLQSWWRGARGIRFRLLSENIFRLLYKMWSFTHFIF